MISRPTSIFCSYAPADEPAYRELAAHLSLLQQRQRISLEHQDNVAPGTNRAAAIATALTNAQVILLLVSSDFFASEECSSSVLPQAMARHSAKLAQVIPILLRPLADWQSAAFGPLQVLPRNEQPISTWKDRDAAWTEVVEEIRHVIDTPPPSVVSTPAAPLPAVWTIPYQRNPVFTGREEVLARLEQQLRTGLPTALSQPQAICGLGGIGKTQLAVEYAYRHAGDYHAVLWVRAESREALTASFVDLAAALQLPQQDAPDLQITVNAVKAWLQIHTDWLLILDNADDLSLMPPFLPRASKGHILLTTREYAMRRLATRIPIDTLTPEVGALFLLRRAGRLTPDAPLEQASPREQEQAKQISHQLGSLPLALDQAGAYIEDTHCSLTDYLHIYQQRRAELLIDRRDLLAEHPDSVATTVSLAVQRIEERHPAAADLLRLCSFLAPDAIPEELFTQGASHLGPTLRPVAADPFLLNQILQVLLSASLISRDPDQKTLSIHRLVQAVLRDAMSEEETQQLAERAVLAVNAAFPKVTFETWPACKRCLPHAQACFPFIEQETVTVPEASDLLFKLSRYLKDRGQYLEAESPLRRSLLLRERQLGPNHLDTAQRLNNLASLYVDQGKYAEAEPLYRRALAICEEHLGPYHPYTASSLNNLAALYKIQGKYAEAEPLYQQALTIRQERLGSGHPNTAASLNNLAGLYKIQGKYAEAEPLYQRALAIREEYLGPHHPNTATSLNDLAELYKSQGKYGEAEPLYQRALSIYEEHLGPHHPNTAASLNNLALLYRSQGRDAEAEPLYRRALGICEERLGLRHPYTLVVRGNYVRLLRKLGRDEEAAEVEARGVEE